jgi:hypothetical protein
VFIELSALRYLRRKIEDDATMRHRGLRRGHDVDNDHGLVVDEPIGHQ